MQVSPSGMAAASQAVPGEFDSRHLLQKEKHPVRVFFFLEIDRILTRVVGGENRESDLFARYDNQTKKKDGKPND